jgi:hypothetical protein
LTRPNKPEPSIVSRGESRIEPEADEPPVVARMVIEIRSDGTRTIARGAIEDTTTGERAAIEAKGTTPLALAASLAKAMFGAPALARQAVRSLLKGRR